MDFQEIRREIEELRSIAINPMEFPIVLIGVVNPDNEGQDAGSLFLRCQKVMDLAKSRALEYQQVLIGHETNVTDLTARLDAAKIAYEVVKSTGPGEWDVAELEGLKEYFKTMADAKTEAEAAAAAATAAAAKAKTASEKFEQRMDEINERRLASRLS